MNKYIYLKDIIRNLEEIYNELDNCTSENMHTLLIYRLKLNSDRFIRYLKYIERTYEEEVSSNRKKL